MKTRKRILGDLPRGLKYVNINKDYVIHYCICRHAGIGSLLEVREKFHNP